MILETVLSGVVGGVARMAPEVLKLFTKKADYKHELDMLQLEMEFAKVKGDIAMRQTEAQMTVAELDSIAEAFKEQSQTASNAGWFVSAISALVRPLVTYWFMFLYSLVKVTTMWQGLKEGGSWLVVVQNNWTVEDMSLLTMILSFWFVGRVYERNKKGS